MFNEIGIVKGFTNQNLKLAGERDLRLSDLFALTEKEWENVVMYW